MALLTSTVLFFLLSCGLWVSEAQKYNAVIYVNNGKRLGLWGPVQHCHEGYAVGFRIKEEVQRMEHDSTGLNAIALLCDNGGIITSATGPWGIWQEDQYCPEGRLVAFALRVEEEVKGDSTGASNIMFFCSDNTVLVGSGTHRGRFGQLSKRCMNGYICAIQTRVQPPQYEADDTALNDVRLICCE